MDKEEWDSLKEGDKVRVKSLYDIVEGGDAVEGLVVHKTSKVNDVYETFHILDMTAYCEEEFEAEEFFYLEGIKSELVLQKNGRHWNFIPDWLEKVVD